MKSSMTQATHGEFKNWHLQKGNDIWFLATIATNPQRSRREIINCHW
jgi:hypothetical protein